MTCAGTRASRKRKKTVKASATDDEASTNPPGGPEYRPGERSDTSEGVKLSIHQPAVDRCVRAMKASDESYPQSTQLSCRQVFANLAMDSCM